MRKMTEMVIGMFFVMLTAGFAGAAEGDVNIDIKNSNPITVTGGAANSNQNQNQSEWQKQQQKMQSTITTPGNLPVASTHAVGQTANQTGDYGRLITNSPLAGSAALFCGMTGIEFEVMVDVINKEGNEEWEDVNDKIISYPFIRRKLPSLNKKDKIYLPSGEMAFQVLRTSSSSQIIGGWFYDTKFKKDNSVLKAHLQMRARIDAAKMGANVVIAIDEFDQRYFVPENFELSLSGVMSWISKCFTSGGSVAGSGGMAIGQNTAFARPGAGFIFLHIEGVDDGICYEFVPPAPPAPAPVVKPEPKPEVCNPSVFIKIIYDLEHNEIKWCFWPCHNNQELRFVKGNAFLDQYYCEGRKNKQLLIQAINEYGIAGRDFKNGRELAKGQHFGQKPKGVRTTTIPAAIELDYKVHYNWALAERELNGELAEIAHAQKYELGKKGTKDMPTMQEDMKR